MSFTAIVSRVTAIKTVIKCQDKYQLYIAASVIFFVPDYFTVFGILPLLLHQKHSGCLNWLHKIQKNLRIFHVVGCSDVSRKWQWNYGNNVMCFAFANSNRPNPTMYSCVQCVHVQFLLQKLITCWFFNQWGKLNKWKKKKETTAFLYFFLWGCREANINDIKWYQRYQIPGQLKAESGNQFLNI